MDNIKYNKKGRGAQSHMVQFIINYHSGSEKGSHKLTVVTEYDLMPITIKTEHSRQNTLRSASWGFFFFFLEIPQAESYCLRSIEFERGVLFMRMISETCIFYPTSTSE